MTISDIISMIHEIRFQISMVDNEINSYEQAKQAVKVLDKKVSEGVVGALKQRKEMKAAVDKYDIDEQHKRKETFMAKIKLLYEVLQPMEKELFEGLLKNQEEA